MAVVRAPIQTVEDIYRLVWAAIANQQPVKAVYKGKLRYFCPHMLGRNRAGERRALCYQYGGESESGLAPAGSSENWRCLVLEKLRAVELIDGAWITASDHSRPTNCVVEADIDVSDSHSGRSRE